MLSPNLKLVIEAKKKPFCRRHGFLHFTVISYGRLLAMVPTMKKRLSTALAEFLKVWGLLTLIIVVGFVITYQYVGAPPPKVVRIATGAKDGAYFAFAEQFVRCWQATGLSSKLCRRRDPWKILLCSRRA